MRTTCAAAPPFSPAALLSMGGQPSTPRVRRRRRVASLIPRLPTKHTHASSQIPKTPHRRRKSPSTDLQHNAANRVDTAHAHEYTKGKMLELAGFMKHLHDGIPIRRHLENGREDKICIRGSGEAGDDGVAWDGLCCSKARTSFTWEELKEVRTYSRATIGKTVHPTATLAKSPMPSGAKAADVDLTFSLILEDGWSLDPDLQLGAGPPFGGARLRVGAEAPHAGGPQGPQPAPVEAQGRVGHGQGDGGAAQCPFTICGDEALAARLGFEDRRRRDGRGGLRALHRTGARGLRPPQGRRARAPRARLPVPRQDPAGYMRFPTRAWHEGQYVIGVVSAYDKATNLYTVDYKRAPTTRRTGLTQPVGQGPARRDGHREGPPGALCVEEAVSSTDNFPFLMILVSLCQVICFAYWAPKMAEANNQEITATTPVAGPQYLWFKTVRNWPYCNDRRQFWYMTLSYQLVHSGLEHIIFNIVLQLIFGIPIELVHGAIVFFIYEVGVIMGALACARCRIRTSRSWGARGRLLPVRHPRGPHDAELERHEALGGAARDARARVGHALRLGSGRVVVPQHGGQVVRGARRRRARGLPHGRGLHDEF